MEETSSEFDSDNESKHRRKETKIEPPSLEYEEENLRERLLKRVKLKTNK